LSAVGGGGDIPKPCSEHASVILGTFWPGSSESSWQTFASGLQSEGVRLFRESEGPQKDVYRLVATDQEGMFIDAAVRLIQRRAATLNNRCDAHKHAATTAGRVASEIWAAKLKMAESVAAAEATITAARTELEPQIQAAQGSGNGLLAMSLTAELEARINTAIQQGQDEVAAASGLGAGEIGTQEAGISSWQPPNTLTSAGSSGAASPMSFGAGGAPAAPAPALPMSGGSGVENVDLVSDSGDRPPDALTPTSQSDQGGSAAGGRPPAKVEPVAATTNGTSPGTPSPGTSSASQGMGDPGSLIGHMMSPLSSAGSAGSGGSSPLSSMGSGLGSFGNAGGANPAGAQAGSMLNPSAAGMPAAGTGVGAGTGAGAGAGQGAGLAGLGTGAAEASARLGTGAVSGVANGLGTVANAGSQVAQNVAPAAATLASQITPAASAAASTTPASVGAGGAPIGGMMPPVGGGGGGPVAPVGGGTPGPAPAATPAAAPPASGVGGPSAVSGTPVGAQVAPMAMPQQHNGIRSIGADGATGAVLIEQAMGAGADVTAAMLAQTKLAGYIPIDYAVSLIYERTGGVTAWLATSEGASCIPLGVRVPQDVKLAVADPVVGRELWEATAAAGGANPLDVVVRHAKAREMAAPGTRVLAIASSIKMADQIGWVEQVGAQPVEVLAKNVGSGMDLGHTLHRCEVAMPWEWRQANAFDAEQRLQFAARHMHMAVTAGHLNGAACEKVMRLFEERKPIADELWEQVHQERFNALVEYDLAHDRLGFGNAELARLLATVRAAEVIESLHHYDTAEGCADLLYATRLAGAPLSAEAAVA
jgi:hypothetical protein